VHLLQLRLTRFGKQVIPLTATGRETLEPLLLMTERDLLFAIGFFDVNPMLQIALDHAAEKKCRGASDRHAGAVVGTRPTSSWLPSAARSPPSIP